MTVLFEPSFLFLNPPEKIHDVPYSEHIVEKIPSRKQRDLFYEITLILIQIHVGD